MLYKRPADSNSSKLESLLSLVGDTIQQAPGLSINGGNVSACNAGSICSIWLEQPFWRRIGAMKKSHCILVCCMALLSWRCHKILACGEVSRVHRAPTTSRQSTLMPRHNIPCELSRLSCLLLIFSLLSLVFFFFFYGTLSEHIDSLFVKNRKTISTSTKYRTHFLFARQCVFPAHLLELYRDKRKLSIKMLPWVECAIRRRTKRLIKLNAK